MCVCFMSLLFRILPSAGDGTHRETIQASFFTIEITLCGNDRLAIMLVGDLNLKRNFIMVFVDDLDVAKFSYK